MPRYFFHIKQDDRLFRDHEGIDLDNLDTGQIIEKSCEVVSEFAFREPSTDGIFVIENSEGRRVLLFPLKAAVWG